MTSPLSFERASKEYVRSHLGRKTVSKGVEDLSLRLEEGEVFGLLGLNGQGKTTAMKLALGLLTPTSGEVRVFGASPCDPRSLASIGFLPELPYFYPYLTPRESLEYYGRLSRIPEGLLRDKVDRALDAVGLGAAAGRKASEFSKGMLQRLGLAQATLHEPRLLLLDEPVSGLDPLAIHDVRAFLWELHRKGCTILLSSHSISDVERLCGRVGILKGGRLARVLESAEWSSQEGGLERLFIDTVRGETP